jgi:hypothetical protein
MKINKNICAAVLATALSTNAFAGTFSDSFSGGLNPSYWSVSQTTPGLYSVSTPGGSVGLSLPNPALNPGGFQNVQINLNLAAFGGNVAGDFSTQVGFDDAIIGPNDDQVQLNVTFADGSTFDDVYDLSSGRNVHLWNGSINNPTPETATSGTFAISRTGSSVTGYYDGTAIFTEAESTALTAVWFSLQNQPNAQGDSPSVSFGNFSYTASAVPEPATLAWGGLGGLASLVVFRRRK